MRVVLYFHFTNWETEILIRLNILSKDFIVSKNPFMSKSLLFILPDTVLLLKLLDLGFEVRKEVKADLKACGLSD